MEATWADKMIEKGRIAEQRRTLLRLMEAKFGAISDGVRLGVDKLQSDVLDTYLERILTANSIEEMGID